MSTTEQIMVKNHSRITEILSNVPKPSGDDHTKTLDYGQKMVCRQPVGSASLFVQNAKQNASIETICTAIGGVAVGGVAVGGVAIGHSLIGGVTVVGEGATVVGLLTDEITIGGSLAIYSATVTAPINRDALILKSIENWIPKNAVEFSSAKFEVTDEILRFCSNHKIVKYLRPIISLIEKSFPSFQEPCLEIEEDPESDEEWLTIDVTVKGEIEEILEYYNNYITKFVSSVPWPERENFDFHIISFKNESKRFPRTCFRACW